MSIKPLGIKTLTIGVALVSGIVAGSMGFGSVLASASNNQSLSNGNVKPAHIYLKNNNGETYGSALDASSLDNEPNLIAAIGEDGIKGYVRSVDVNGVMPKTPEEAIAQQNKLTAGTAVEIPLYDVNDKIIGSFKTHITKGINKPTTSINEQDIKDARGESTSK